MLAYEEFKETLKEEVQKDVEGILYFTVMVKNNHEEKETLSIKTKEYNCVPVIHLKELYENYQDGETIDECVDFVKEILETKKEIGIEEIWGTWEEKKKDVCIRLVNKEWNQEKLEELPHQIFCDLAVTFRLEFSASEDRKAGCDIQYSMLEHWGITEQELAQAAFENLNKEEYAIRDMEEIVAEILGLPIPEETRGLQYVMTNANTFYGAAGMLRIDLLRKFAEEQGSDFYILPSSLHEIILLPEGQGFSEDELRSMVREINQTEVEMSERLSDEIYKFDRKTSSVELVKHQQ